jgi:hypothetical protein
MMGNERVISVTAGVHTGGQNGVQNGVHIWVICDSHYVR